MNEEPSKPKNIRRYMQVFLHKSFFSKIKAERGERDGESFACLYSTGYGSTEK